MSTTLKSFDLDDDNSFISRKPQTPKLRGLNTRNQQLSIFRSRETIEDDIEFDDTRMDMTEQGAFNIEGMNGGNRRRSNVYPQSNYLVKNTTTTVPLKDTSYSESRSRPNRSPYVGSTPDVMLGRINKHRSRNGTPLKLPPLNSSHLSSDSERQNQKILPEENVEDSLIKHRKLISDDNKFSPGNARGTVNTRNSLNGLQDGSPTRRNDRPIIENVTTPPSNLKVRPFSFESASKKLPSLSGPGKKLFDISKEEHSNENDIEFDSSDIDDNGTSGNIHLSSFSKLNGQIEHQSPNLQTTTHSQAKPNFNQELGYQSEGILVSQPERHSPPRIEKNTENSVENFDKQKNENGLDTKSAYEEYGDISRAEILEKINSTINTLIERDRSASSPLKEATLKEDRISLDNANLIESISDDDSSDESPDEILNELDSVFHSNLSNSGIQNIEIMKEKSPAEDRGSPYERRAKATPIRTHYSRLSDKYARQILKRRKNESNTKEVYPDMDVRENNDVPLAYESTEWPTEKWLKLNKVLQLEKLTKKDIINSEVLLSRLGCSSKEELKQRVEFLIQFNRSQKSHRTPGRQINGQRKNKLSLKSSSSRRRFGII